jgi:Domain of unknown function (DUF1996)/WSC domain
VVYYLGRGDNRFQTVPFPPGFRMISGDSGARHYDETVLTYKNTRPTADRASFACLDKSGPMAAQPYMFRTDCSSGLRAQIHFQSCWDGVNLYKTDNSHVAFMSGIDNGQCPPTHPKQLAHIFLEVYYGVNDVDKSDGGFFVFANGDKTGYSFHGDFQNGWDMDVQTAAIAQCLTKQGSSGSIADCPPLAASTDPFFGWNCPERPPIVNETVHGWIGDKLPGCNTITGFQDARALGTNCPAVLNPTVPQPSAKRFSPAPGYMMGDWTYLGCTVDTGRPRTLSGAGYTDATGMTIDACQAYCASKNSPIAGLKYGRECQCGSTIASTNPLQDVASCAAAGKMRCAGNDTQICGATNLLTLWKNTNPSAPQVSSASSASTVSTIKASSTTKGTSTATSTVVVVSPVSTPSNAPATGPIEGVTTIYGGKGLYLGCYNEVSGRTLTNGAGTANSTGMTNEYCAAYCTSRNYAYFGTEYAQECYCSNTISSVSVTQLGTDCSMNCRGDSSQKCGGSSRLSLWSNVAYVAPHNLANVNNGQFSYVGCFTEGKTGRALTGLGKNPSYSRSDSVAMTVEMCSALCFNKGYNWMGIEYGQECYCNNDGPINGAAAAATGDKECNTLCKGDITEFCGAASRLSLYRKIGSGATSKVVNSRSAKFSKEYQV